MPSAISAKNGLCRSLSSTPIGLRAVAGEAARHRVGPVAEARRGGQDALAALGLTFGLSRITSDTSARETPASRATSSIVA